MYRLIGLRRAPLWGALLAFWSALFSLDAPAEQKECLSFRADEWATIEYVYDGDTVRLSDGRKIRLIGINAPEISHDSLPSEPFGEAARQALQRLLDTQGPLVALRYGEEKRDKYGRWLAHAYLKDQSNVQERLLEEGLAFAVAVAPNLANLACYQSAEIRGRGKGAWLVPRFQPMDTRRLPRDARGYYVIEGIVERVGESRRSIWLNFPGRVAVKIDKKDLHNFSKIKDPRHLQGKQLRVRGWLYEQQGELRMRVYHSFALEIVR